MRLTFDHKKIEKNWQKKWTKAGINTPDVKKPKNHFYNLWMFPYPSAEGLHAGHAFASTGSDVYGRFIRMQGKNVFQPIGYDSFGIHSENFALSIKEHPEPMIERTTKYYEKQLKSLGHGYDWTRTVTTSNPDYYRWTQWLFVEMFKAGLAYRKKAEVNWCPSCKTVLADEQVIQGECERCGHKVITKELEQWFFRITDYADRLLRNLEKIDWPEKIKTAQRNWIGKSVGATLKFPIHGGKEYIESFTTRPDTLYGATFFVLAPEHPHVLDVTISKHKSKVQRYVSDTRKKSKVERVSEDQAKSGVATGGYVINPATNKKIPVFVADYVVMDYGTGAIMGVPGHDDRDWEFAKAHKLPIVEVISGGKVKSSAYDGPGRIVNSDDWNGMRVPGEIKKIINDVRKKGWGRPETSYHLRDWLISRQRYWGPPIPMIFCKECAKEGRGWFTARSNSGRERNKRIESRRDPIASLQDSRLLHKDQSDWDHAGWWPEEKLPVKLPYLENYQPKGTKRGPLSEHSEFYEVKCPECGHNAKRETDVSDTFLDSSWYFLRYPSTRSARSGQAPFDPKITKKWLPVDLYFGGAEHAVLHLMYARFVNQVLYDLKLINFEEPFPRFYAHGLMIKDGAKMSKSRGNTVNPSDYIEKFGADTFRLFLMFMGPMDGYPDFIDTGIEGMRRFVDRVWDLYANYPDVVLTKENDCREVLIKMHQTIKKVTKDIEKFHYNTAISSIMEFLNLLREKTESKTRRAKGGIRCAEWDEALRVLVQLLAPFAPHTTEEIWVNILGEKFSIHKSKWPKFVPELIKEETVTIPVQVDGKLRATLKLKAESSKLKAEVVKAAKADPRIKKWLKNKKIKTTVFVQAKLVNFVTK